MGPGWREAVGDLPDPRDARGQRHRLDEMLTIAVCAVVCGADDCSEIADFGRAKEPWFRTFLELRHGVPSDDTFRRVLAALEPDALERCLLAWLQGWNAYRRGGHVALDGKSLRRSHDRASGKAAVHMIGAWATEAGLSLGQLAVDPKGNEITALPKLMRLLDLKDATVTIDAIGCQSDIAAQIVEQGGDYVLAMKSNQQTLYEEAKLFLDSGISKGFGDFAHDFHECVDGGHGRIETRRAWVTSAVEWFEDRERWPGLRSFACIECERSVGEKTTTQRRYFISSLDGNSAQRIAEAVRNHWQIENNLHWVLDMAFADDQSRLRAGHAAENLTRLKRVALSLLKRETSAKVGMKGKRLKAGWDEAYLLKVLAV